VQTQIDDNERRLGLWQEDLRWYGHTLGNML
jgi:hypothetical protein